MVQNSLSSVNGSSPKGSTTAPILRALLPAHAGAAARLHIAGQPGTFLTSLGQDVLAVIYGALPASAHGFGFVALAATNPTDAPDAQPEADLRVLGFVSATSSVGALFAQVAARSLPALAPPLLRACARQPALLWRSMQTALYPLLVREEAQAGASAELLSIMVEPDARSAGIGAALLEVLLTECARRQIAQLDVTVDAANEGARRFYARHGFALHKDFTLYGRAMCQYVRRVAPAESSPS